MNIPLGPPNKGGKSGTTDKTSEGRRMIRHTLNPIIKLLSPSPSTSCRRILYPMSLRFRKEDLETTYAQHVQRQAAKNLWWSLLLLVGCIALEYSATALLTEGFRPKHKPSHLAYTIGVFTIVLSGVFVSGMSAVKGFYAYIELIISLGGSLLCGILVFLVDHWRVARLLEDISPNTIWKRDYFSDGPLLLGLMSILLSICIYLPVRSICLWPVSMSSILCYAFATFVFNSPDGNRPAVLNVLLLILLNHLAFAGRRALEAQQRLQFHEVYQAGFKIKSLEQQIQQVNQRPPTTLESLFDSLKDATKRMDYVRTLLHDDYPDLAAQLESGIAEVKESILHLTRIDTLLQVNVNAIIERRTSSVSVNDTTKKFIKENFMRGRTESPLPAKGKVSRRPTKIRFSVMMAPRAAHDGHESTRALCEGLGTEWNFNMLQLNEATANNALVTVGIYVLEPFVSSSLRCAQQVVVNFLSEIQRRYKAQPYHNAAHGADVCHSTLFLVQHLCVFDKIDEVDQLAVIVAALAHDVGHPARSNAFQIAIGSDLAVRYNDMSVLENFHSAQTFEVLRTDDCNIMQGREPEEWRAFRSAVIDMILETDMNKHFESISKFKVRIQNDDFDIVTRSEDRFLTAKMCVKAADIGHSTKEWNLHYAWSQKVTEEFFEQGDEELARGLPVSPLCDRSKMDEVPKSQSGFLQYVCLDIFQHLAYVEEKVKMSDYMERLTHHMTHHNGATHPVSAQHSNVSHHSEADEHHPGRTQPADKHTPAAPSGPAQGPAAHKGTTGAPSSKHRRSQGDGSKKRQRHLLHSWGGRTATNQLQLEPSRERSIGLTSSPVSEAGRTDADPVGHSSNAHHGGGVSSSCHDLPDAPPAPTFEVHRCCVEQLLENKMEWQRRADDTEHKRKHTEGAVGRRVLFKGVGGRAEGADEVPPPLDGRSLLPSLADEEPLPPQSDLTTSPPPTSPPLFSDHTDPPARTLSPMSLDADGAPVGLISPGSPDMGDPSSLRRPLAEQMKRVEAAPPSLAPSRAGGAVRVDSLEIVEKEGPLSSTTPTPGGSPTRPGGDGGELEIRLTLS
ncbi:unnamed protein product [Vitrella brassicaformis CCMP3155]|uniref:Phosphodiesterase n=2 Tax=Vitrella brassicaformis TaxID=1169539 RepID=A0A0G4FGJ6_VITBC|nr:unnamed protein product [Vitrella brassicaformis CCMP3155]|eukprot:CEM12202.1 unnamed protein product [Vitrella brassicaformis CCMP3155]